MGLFDKFKATIIKNEENKIANLVGESGYFTNVMTDLFDDAEKLQYTLNCFDSFKSMVQFSNEGVDTCYKLDDNDRYLITFDNKTQKFVVVAP
ncbi:hypothetical protein [Psychromonas antarctica]|uniref:hypothetical protein n=1 Tax=Psychromonas antarctica TaxID=67573 RepID=UPI001EE8155D|nr:hypothetical protein [Psychromonas antarctica]MCG6202512.1 hypothetical protein [Psychromonas antarctica]